MRRPEALDVDALLTIDVDAEIRKLSRAQLEGPWQLPAELVRRAMGSYACDIEITLDRDSLVVRDDGDPLPQEQLAALATLLDEGAARQARHRALVALEKRGAALIALAGLRSARVRIDAHERHRTDQLVHEPGQPARLSSRPVDGERWATRIELAGAGLDPERVREWLESACRFTPATISFNGEPLIDVARTSLRWPDVLYSMELPRPLEGELGIPHEGEKGCLWLLLDGVVSAHVSLVKVPCFEAALELSEAVGADRGAAAVRELGLRYVPALSLVAAYVTAALAAQDLGLDEARGRRLRILVALAAKYADEEKAVAQVRAVAVYPTLPGPGGVGRRLSLDDLARLAREDGGRLTALTPEDDPSHYVLPDAPVLVLDKAERGLLSRVLGVGFRAPPLRPKARDRRARNGLLGEDGPLARAARWLRHGSLPPPLPEEALSPAERAFLADLQRALPAPGDEAVEVHLCEGQGPIRRLGKSPRWRLPRENPTVRACLNAWSRDPTWIYPAALAVLNGQELPANASRGAWLRR